MTKQVIHGGEIEVQLAGVFGPKRPHLQIDDDEATQPIMIEEEVDIEIVATHFQVILTADEGEADSEFQKKLTNVIEKPRSKSRSSTSSPSVRKSKL
jgi:hypothetical protein